MALKYLKTQQIVPDKGMSFTLYEIEGENTILRMLTTIPEAGMVKCYPKPPVKTLFQAHVLEYKCSLAVRNDIQFQFEAIVRPL